MDERVWAAFKTMRVGGLELDRPDPGLARVLARKLKHMGIEIDAENPALAPDDPRHVQRHMAAAAADIEHMVAAPELRVFKEPQGCLAHDVGKQVEAALPVLAAGDRIGVRRGAAPTGQIPLRRQALARFRRKRRSRTKDAAYAFSRASAAATTASGVMPKC